MRAACKQFDTIPEVARSSARSTSLSLCETVLAVFWLCLAASRTCHEGHMGVTCQSAPNWKIEACSLAACFSCKSRSRRLTSKSFSTFNGSATRRATQPTQDSSTATYDNPEPVSSPMKLESATCAKTKVMIIPTRLTRRLLCLLSLLVSYVLCPAGARQWSQVQHAALQHRNRNFQRLASLGWLEEAAGCMSSRHVTGRANFGVQDPKRKFGHCRTLRVRGEGLTLVAISWQHLTTTATVRAVPCRTFSRRSHSRGTPSARGTADISIARQASGICSA